jgi:hypothetical protein
LLCASPAVRQARSAAAVVIDHIAEKPFHILSRTLHNDDHASMAASQIIPCILDMTPPIRGLALADLRDTFEEVHDGHKHEAIDIVEPKGTPVRAVVSGTIRKLFLSKPGGNTIYQFDEMGVYCYYYAHLDGYVEGLHEGMPVKSGDVIGFVGSTGNADPRTPHLHLAITDLGPERLWWKGKAVDPYPFLVAAVKRTK